MTNVHTTTITESKTSTSTVNQWDTVTKFLVPTKTEYIINQYTNTMPPAVYLNANGNYINLQSDGGIQWTTKQNESSVFSPPQDAPLFSYDKKWQAGTDSDGDPQDVIFSAIADRPLRCRINRAEWANTCTLDCANQYDDNIMYWDIYNKKWAIGSDTQQQIMNMGYQTSFNMLGVKVEVAYIEE